MLEIIVTISPQKINYINYSLYHQLENHVDEIYRIGDCIKARNFIDATHEAYLVAQDL